MKYVLGFFVLLLTYHVYAQEREGVLNIKVIHPAQPKDTLLYEVMIKGQKTLLQVMNKDNKSMMRIVLDKEISRVWLLTEKPERLAIEYDYKTYMNKSKEMYCSNNCKDLLLKALPATEKDAACPLYSALAEDAEISACKRMADFSIADLLLVLRFDKSCPQFSTLNFLPGYLKIREPKQKEERTQAYFFFESKKINDEVFSVDDKRAKISMVNIMSQQPNDKNVLLMFKQMNSVW